LTERRRGWLELGDQFVQCLGEDSPITFLLGAGASVTSQSPTTAKVEEAWMVSTGIFDRRRLLSELADVNLKQKQNAILPLFSRVAPYFGYLALASLARRRAVYVINLNWDDALEQACKWWDVPFHPMFVRGSDDRLGVRDHDDPLEQSDLDERLGDPTPGVYALHLHGMLRNEASGIRIGLYETLRFDSTVMDALDKYYFPHPTLMVGASFTGEYDVTVLLRTLAGNSRPQARRGPFYIFSRQSRRAPEPDNKLIQHVLFQNASSLNFRGDPDIDFDRLMLEIAAKDKGIDPWAEASKKSDVIVGLEATAIPAPRVLQRALRPDSEAAVVISGDAYIGKTSATALLVHAAQLCATEELTVSWVSGPGHSADSLERLLEAAPDEAARTVLVLRDPFVRDEKFELDERFAELYNRFVTDPPQGARVIITTRASKWLEACQSGRLEEGAGIVSESTNDWYTTPELTAYQDFKAGQSWVRRDIYKGEQATPAAIQDAIDGDSGRRTESIGEKIEYLEILDDDGAWFAILARLQELWPRGVNDLPLVNGLANRKRLAQQTNHLVREVGVGDYDYVVPAHSMDREAIDAFYSRHHERFRDRLDLLASTHGSPDDACLLWAAVRDLRDGGTERLADLSPAVRANWGGALLDEATRSTSNTEELRDRVLCALESIVNSSDPNFWELREITFETIRLWPVLTGDSRAYRFLDDLVADRPRMGLYLILEAMTYVQAATYPDTWDLSAFAEVLDRVRGERHLLLREPEANLRELALIFDAFAWCPPHLEGAEFAHWMQPMIRVARDECPALETAMHFSSIYHPLGVRQMRARGVIGIPATSDRPMDERDAAAASFMIGWHFLHQSRARAIRYRRDLEPAHAYLLGSHADKNALAMDPDAAAQARRLIEQMSVFEQHRGWAVHLLMNLSAVRTGFRPEFAARLIGRLPDEDVGVTTAVLAYDVPDDLRPVLRSYFKKAPNKSFLLDALHTPPVVEGVAAGAPGFAPGLRPRDVQRALGIDYPNLADDHLPVNEEQEFLRLLDSAAHSLMSMGEEGLGLSVESVEEAYRVARSGDLRALSTARSERRLASEVTLLDTMIERLRSAAQDVEDGRESNFE